MRAPYTTDLLPKGRSEAEQGITLREGRSTGDFHLVQTRTELSHGLTNDLQLSGYNSIDAVIHGLNNADDFKSCRFRPKLGTFL